MQESRPRGYQPENEVVVPEAVALPTDEPATEIQRPIISIREAEIKGEGLRAKLVELTDDPARLHQLVELMGEIRFLDIPALDYLAYMGLKDREDSPIKGLHEVRYEKGSVLVWLALFAFPEEFRAQLFELGRRLDESPLTNDPSEARQIVEQTYDQYISEVPDKRLLHNFSAAEIGGWEMAALRHWGAEVTNTWEWEVEGQLNENVSSENYRSVFGDKQYDISYSCAVFDTGSGYDAEYSYDQNLEKLSFDLLKVYSAITKPGGLSIHYTAPNLIDLVRDDYWKPRISDELGLRVILTSPNDPITHQGDYLVIFQKQ